MYSEWEGNNREKDTQLPGQAPMCFLTWLTLFQLQQHKSGMPQILLPFPTTFYHRITEWLVLERTLKIQPPATDRNKSYLPAIAYCGNLAISFIVTTERVRGRVSKERKFLLAVVVLRNDCFRENRLKENMKLTTIPQITQLILKTLHDLFNMHLFFLFSFIIFIFLFTRKYPMCHKIILKIMVLFRKSILTCAFMSLYNLTSVKSIL